MVHGDILSFTVLVILMTVSLPQGMHPFTEFCVLSQFIVLLWALISRFLEYSIKPPGCIAGIAIALINRIVEIHLIQIIWALLNGLEIMPIVKRGILEHQFALKWFQRVSIYQYFAEVEVQGFQYCAINNKKFILVDYSPW